MKKIFRLLMVAMGVLVMNSCSSDYLNTSPESSTGTATIFETVDNMELAINGLYRQMTQQYGAFGQGYNGEGTIKHYLGNYASNHWNRFTSMNIYLLDNSYHINPQSTWIILPWYYYYRIIGNANAVIVYGPDAEGDEAKRDYLIAQAKVMRAYCYMQLSQRFHYAWFMGKSDEAKNGNGLVLRLDTSTGSMGLSSANDTYAQITTDLNEAIAVLEKDAYKRNAATENYQINKDVAYAVYARAALIKGDYATSAQYAQKARKDYPLMSNKDYFAGFNTPTSEWIWSSYGSETETLYYYSFFAYNGFEANTSAVRNYPISIGKALYESIPETDVRREMWLAPEPGEKYSQTNGQITDKKSPSYVKIFAKYPQIPSTAKIAAWHQMKFQSLDGVGVGHVNHFRASEMYLIEAECQYKMGNESAAQKLLEELNVTSGRDPEYTCTKTGDELFAEIKKYRGIELWGEGFGWFDLKRWNDPIDRKHFSEGGNSYLTYAVKCVQEQTNNWWTSVLPEKETNYNEEV
ncbi:MAG: RagB/SusD family nutrient uptake outer membrane protein [Bacteroidales bacterium]|nr:RagB/SusD family nutrient uptake outer membrane protein [Bacteroidales bacterium]